jgi:hypothetical protein
MTSRIQTNVSSGVDIYITFETTATFTPQTDGIVLEFPDADDGEWCRTAGTDLVVTGVDPAPADSTGDFEVDAPLPGTLSGECTQGASGTSDRITIDGATELTAGQTYGVKIEEASTAVLGTASSTGEHIVSLTVRDTSNIETKSFGISLVGDDTVTVSAEVVDVQTVTCELGATTANLGNLYKGGSFVTTSHNISTYTSSSAGGYYWAVYGYGNGTNQAGLQHTSQTGANTLIESDDPGSPSSTIDISTANTRGFGLNVDLLSATGVNIGTGFDDSVNSSGVFGSISFGPSNAELLLYQIGAQSTSESVSIIYGARANSDTVAGTYQETVTFVCGGYY